MVSFNRLNFKDNNNNSPYAHVVKENPLQAVASSIKTHTSNVSNLHKALVKPEGTDYSLGRMNDTTIRLGSLGIATLASSKSLSGVAGVGEFIGFATWFAAMGLSPKIINKMVQLKYGLNLDKEYIDSYGRRKKLFDDPGFVCWDLIPKEEIDLIGDRMNVPRGIVNRREAIQEKITQIVIQSKTWLLLSAGVSTPVLASLVADTLKKPFNKLLDLMHARSLDNLETNIRQAINAGRDEEAQKILSKVVDNTFGMKEGSAIARIWQSTPERVVKGSGLLNGAVSHLETVLKDTSGTKAWISKVAGEVPIANESKKIQAIVDYLANNPNTAQKGIDILNNDMKIVQQWHDKLLPLAQKAGNQQLQEFISLRTRNLQSGYNNMKKVFESAVSTAPDKELLKLMTGCPAVTTTSQVRLKLIETYLKGVTDSQAGRWNVDRLAAFVGDDVAKEVKLLLEKGQTEKAIDLLSKRPIKFADDAITNTLLHNRWLKRIGVIAVGLIAATALFVFLFMGRSNKYNPEITQNQGKK